MFSKMKSVFFENNVVILERSKSPKNLTTHQIHRYFSVELRKTRNHENLDARTKA
tara:strand:+ start:191 stop:355 length:165 start_codon:yes stop_codon:yes gene_type:complete